ncbi:hypothetical protein ACSS6W_010352 [Trichoderma asperelloides]|uniref:Uncharacterized protein n=2 Tax=Trichoderma asperellum TaxID=101201 RepID=A0A6V8R2Y8_TRIAP|nr:hypothetical protein M441DRAFT_399486 [Trichoderma asperellum CBS 433.97]PTB41491.1 hypothetical protein M441DRAFT_399486 [Trichoderma asperellum CBS 433.97]UKZ95045.1 hypothetical protein TrAFT101_009897 [Trichoderma asperellum]GFP57368.1 hypothetical protein TASIC1_0008020900 [Trichoderma asperellum]
MKFSLFAVAALPALAFAQSTTTETSTTVLTKTVTLARLHTVTAVASHNATTTSASYQSIGTAVSTGVGSTAFKPTSVPSTGAPIASATKGPHSAGVALEASKVALVGVAGMMIFAMM